MRALITGASGFVGSALARSLARAGHTVVALTRDPARARERIGEGAIEIAEGSIGDPAQIARAARGCAVLYHAAGIAALDAPTRVLRWVHVAGTENVLRAARHCGVRRVIHVSCADVSLGEEDRMHWDEARALTDQPIGPHAQTKLMAEEIALAGGDESLEVVSLRPALLWGPDDVDGLARLVRSVRQKRFTLFGGGRNVLATTHIDNLSNAALLAADAPNARSLAYYVTDGEFLEAREFYGRLFQALELPPPPLSGSLALALAKASARDLLHANKGAARAEVLRFAKSALFDVSRAVRDLNYAATIDLEQRFGELAAWVRANGGVDGLLARARPAPAASDVDAQVRAAGGD